MSSDSTGTDEDLDKIKEAVDLNFLTGDLFASNDWKNKSEISPKPTSRRNQNGSNVSNNPFSLKVTPEFQSHVSKHLSQLLDELIDDTKVILGHKKLKTRPVNYGVKLLSSSKVYLRSADDNKSALKTKKLVKEDFNSVDYKKRAKEVAVTPEWVLSQEETRHWTTNTKGEIEIVKLDDYSNENLFQTKNSSF